MNTEQTHRHFPIGVFDSGIGGVTILKEIVKLLPHENILYYSDSLHNPYGNKSPEAVYEIVKNIVEYLLAKDCKMIVIACNTATALTVDRLRDAYPEVTFIATEPAYKMVYDHARDATALVLATPGTMQSERFHKIYDQYNNHRTYLYSCDGLADLIEQNRSTEICKYLAEKLAIYHEKKVEAIVLGCTHYPLIKKELLALFPNALIFDSSNGVSRQLERKLQELDLLNPTSEKGTITFIDSSNRPEKKERFFEILNEE